MSVRASRTADSGTRIPPRSPGGTFSGPACRPCPPGIPQRAVKQTLLAAMLCIAAGLASAPSLGAEQDPVTTIVVANPTGEARAAGPVTFGMIFAKGDAPGSVAVRGRPTQADVKRRWPDGSVKHAVLTVALPGMGKGAAARLELVPAGRVPARTGAAAKGAAAGVEDVVVQIAIHGGPTLSASLAKAIRSARPRRVWLDGGLAREAHFLTVPADAKGRPDADLEVRFRVRRYPAARTARVAVIVENTKWNSPGGVPYDATVRIGGRQVFAQQRAGTWPKEKHYAGHARWTRWLRRFWTGRRLDDVRVRCDPKYLCSTGLLPRYDPRVKVAEGALAKLARTWDRAAADILQRGVIMAYFPTTGGRPDIGPLPRWCARYLLSQDPRARRVTWGAADLSGSCPVHVRDPNAGGWYIDIDRYPGYSFNDRGTKFRVAPRDTTDTPWVIDKRSHFHVDSAHQASLAYVPYLLGGDYYHLEEMCFWAARNMVERNYAYRGGAEGIVSGQTRGIAWALRNVLHAAALAPDGSKEKRYFEAKLDNNLRHLAALPAGPDASSLGIFTYGKTHAYTRGWPGDWRSRYYSMPPWQHNFLAWFAAHAADHGYAAAEPFRDYMMTFTIGLMTHADEITPYAATSYFVFIGRAPREKGAPDRMARSWKEMSDLTYRSPTPPGVTIREPTRISGAGYGSSYGHIARGVVIEALRAGRPGAKEALEWIDAQLPDLEKVFADDPTWALDVPAGR